jgi:hypothetical protein
MPNAINMQAGNPGNGGSVGAAPMAFKAYDTSSGNTSGNPIAVVNTPNGYAPVTLNASFTQGLFIVQTTPGSIAVSFT